MDSNHHTIGDAIYLGVVFLFVIRVCEQAVILVDKLTNKGKEKSDVSEE